MAVVDLKITGNSTDTTSYTTTSFTPAANDLLVVFVIAAGTTDAAATLVDSLGGTYTKITSCLSTTSANTGYLYVANQLAPASLMTVTFDCSGDASTGATINVFGVSGCTRTGTSAVRASGKQDNAAGGTTPTVALGGAALTTNPVLGLVHNTSAPATITPPAGFTEARDLNMITPTTGYETAFIDSGFTSSSVTWGSSSVTQYGSIAVEIDRSTAVTNITVTGVQATATNAAQVGGLGVSPSRSRAESSGTAQPSSAALSLLGVRASATATGQPGSFAAQNATVTGVQATATATAQPGGVGMLSDWYQLGTSASVTGVRATATATGQAGAVTISSPAITVAGAQAGSSATAGQGKIGMLSAWYGAVGSTLVSVTGAQALATASGQAGVASGGLVTLAGAQATAVAAAHGGTISVPLGMGPGLAWMFMSGQFSGVLVAGGRATSTATAQPGATLVEGDITITGVQAVAFSDGQEGDSLVTFIGARAAATATGQPGTVTTANDVAVTGVRALSTATGQAGAAQIALPGAQAQATAVAAPGAPQATLLGVQATAAGVGQPGTVLVAVTGSQAAAAIASVTAGATILAGQDVTFSGQTATSTATGQAGSVLLTQYITGAQAFATATGQAGAFAGIQNILVAGSISTATATGQGGVVAYTSDVFGEQAFAAAFAQAGDPLYDSLVIGERGLATATGTPGRGGGGGMPRRTTRTRIHSRNTRTIFHVTTGARTRVTVGSSGKTLART